jgi:hypothetical protein
MNNDWRGNWGHGVTLFSSLKLGGWIAKLGGEIDFSFIYYGSTQKGATQYFLVCYLLLKPLLNEVAHE